jgi:DNA-binding MarR family transcriptional regulator
MIDKATHRLNRYHFRFMDERLAPLGLSGPAGGPLTEIARRESVKMNVLAGLFPFHKSHITRVVQHLVETGYVEKSVDLEDGRGFILTITEPGRRAAREVNRAHEEWERLIDQALTEEEQIAYRDITLKVCRKAAEYFAEDPDDETL